MLGGNIMRREVKRKWIGILRAVTGVDERRREQRRRGTQIVISEGRNAIHDAGAKPGKRGVEDAVAGADAALSSLAEYLLENSFLKFGE